MATITIVLLNQVSAEFITLPHGLVYGPFTPHMLADRLSRDLNLKRKYSQRTTASYLNGVVFTSCLQ